MSWNASGTDIEGPSLDESDFNWSPAFDSMPQGMREQAEFCLSAIEEAFSSDALDTGKYNISMNGHVPTDEEVGSGRHGFSVSCVPVGALVNESGIAPDVGGL